RELEALLQNRLGKSDEIPVDVVACVAAALGISWEKAHPLIRPLGEGKFEYQYPLSVPRNCYAFLLQTIERKSSSDGYVLRMKGHPRLEVRSALQAGLFERGKEARQGATFRVEGGNITGLTHARRLMIEKRYPGIFDAAPPEPKGKRLMIEKSKKTELIEKSK